MSTWKSIKLIDLCDVEYGTRVVRKRDAGTIFPVYGGGGATFSMDVYNRENRIVIARFAMSEKCTRFVKGKFFLNDSGLTISAKDKKLIDEQFLNYQMLSLNDTIYSLARGTAQKNLNVDEFKNLSLSFPNSTQEQKEIVGILDQAFESIEKAKANIEKNIENAKELFQSKLNQTFSQKNEDWEQVPLGNLGKITSSKRIYKKEYVNSGIPYYRSKEIKELAHGKSISLELFIKKTRYEDIKRDFGIPKVGDILITAIGATIGEIYVIENDNPFYFKDGNVLWLKDFNSINPDYLKLCLKYFLNNILSITRGSAYPALTIEKLKKYMVYVPTNDVQEIIVETLDIMDNHVQSLLSSYEEELKNLEELKKSILQKAFSGELTNKNKAA